MRALGHSPALAAQGVLEFAQQGKWAEWGEAWVAGGGEMEDDAE